MNAPASIPNMPAAPADPAHAGLPVDQIGPGRCGVVTAIDAADDDISRLMVMGVCVGRKVELVQAGDPLILRVLGSRIGVSARLARRVFVHTCSADSGGACAPG